mgnify:CR=1 FL=1
MTKYRLLVLNQQTVSSESGNMKKNTKLINLILVQSNHMCCLFSCKQH